MRTKFFNEIKNFINDKRVKDLLLMCNHVTTSFAPFAEKRTKWTFLQGVFNLVKECIESSEEYPGEFFYTRGWIEIFSGNFAKLIAKHLNDLNCLTIKTESNTEVIKIVDLYGTQVAWADNLKYSWRRVDSIHAHSDRVVETERAITQFLKEKFKKKSFILKKNNIFSVLDEGVISIELDEEFIPLYSEKSRECVASLEKYFSLGQNRALMLHGPPGTGKSTMAKTLTHELGLVYMKINVEDIGDIGSNTIAQCIDVFSPDAVIFDDIDRTEDQELLLYLLEYLQKHVKLVVATANKRGSLDEALLRPGRFDELIFLDKIDREAILKVLGNSNEEAYEVVKDWPVAFIKEYVKRRCVMSKEEAESSMKELADRVDRLKEYADDEVNTWASLQKKKETTRVLVKREEGSQDK